MNKVNLSEYDNSWFNPGGSSLKRLIWYFINILFLKNSLNPCSAIKVFVLKLFGAEIGKGVVIKPCVNIKYPWNLKVGDFVWIGENVWIDNLAEVEIGNNVCISQGAMLLCGNHNYKEASFDLMIGKIKLEDGSWIGAQTVVCPGVKVSTHAVLGVGSIANHDLDAYSIYQGNPAQFIRNRKID